MRVVTNERQVKRGRQRGTVMFFVSLAVLTGGLLITNFIPVSPVALLIVPCAVMPLGILFTVLSIRLTNEYLRTPRPEEAIREGLEGIKNAVLYNYFTPRHVLITPYGVYAIVTRFQITKVKFSGETVHNYRNKGPLAPVFLFLRQEGMGNPYEEVQTDTATLQVIVDETLPDLHLTVQPLIVFISPKAVLELEDPIVPVVYASPEKKPSLRNALKGDQKDKLRDQAEKLTEDQITLLEAALQAQLSEREFEDASEEEYA
ncbi:MAG TPA: hypothetical protein PLD47_14780 [Aggregatilineales bacterium]|nr:hypothetical protein [Anaerolineales bacterium]HRE48990.1 hypothetical protein [Aggregatilineales bacterium]